MQTQSKVLKWSLVIGIVVVLNLFFNYTLSLVYKHPTFEAFCPMQQVNKVVSSQKACVEQGGQWNENIPDGGNTSPVSQIKGVIIPAGYCNLQFTCQNKFETAQRVYDRNVFITLVILGAICVALASFLGGNAVISVALSLAGVLSFIVASMRYWSSADDLIKVIILAIALLILIWVALKKFKNNQPIGPEKNGRI